MLKNRWLSAAAALLVGGLPVHAQASSDADVVQLRDGKQQSIAIEAENWDAVVGKGSPAIPWDDVLSIEYANASDFSKAVGDFRAGNYASAREQFDQLESDPKLRKVFKQEIAYDTAYALQAEGDSDAAIAAYQAVIDSYPKGRYHVRAAENLANLLAQKDPAGALKTVDGFVAGAGEPGLAAALGLVKARLLIAQNKPADAKPLFAAATSAKGAPAWVAFEGQLGQGACLFLEGKLGEAETLFRDLTKAAAPKHVLAGAWNGLGDILSDQGFKKKDIDQLIDALYCYLRGSTVYAPIDGEPTEQYERSLAGSMRCFGNVADLIDAKQNADRKALYKQRAEERKEVLKKEFPSSRFLD